MSTLTVEVVPVEDLELLLGQSPPCEALVNGARCGRPAAARVTINCADCGPHRCFLCADCLGAVQRGRASCAITRGCGRRDFAWAEI